MRYKHHITKPKTDLKRAEQAGRNKVYSLLIKANFKGTNEGIQVQFLVFHIVRYRVYRLLSRSQCT